MDFIFVSVIVIFTIALNYALATMHNFPKPDDLLELAVIFIVYFIVFRWALSANKG